MIDKLNSNLIIQSNPQEFTAEEALFFQKNIEEGFIYSIKEIQFKNSEFEKFMTELRKIAFFTEFDYSNSKNSVNKLFTSEVIKVNITGNVMYVECNISCTSEELSNSIWKLYLENIETSTDVNVYMTSYYMQSGMLSSTGKDISTADLGYISDRYYPYIKTDVMFDQFFTGSENILVIVGKPGVGKSKLGAYALKYAAKNTDKLPYDKISECPHLEQQYITAIYVKSIDVLVSDQFWRDLESENSDFVFIDDLDYMLTKRDSEVQSSDDQQKNSFLNQFLSFTDGIQKSKTKFIITTNQTYDSIDSALLRKGRLFDILELRDLTKDEAEVIWVENDLDVKTFDETFPDYHILPADLGSEINKHLNTRIANSRESYLLDPRVSKLIDAKRSKKIGL